jgi:ABC-2 type transport system ATP-binding protein
LGKKGLKMPQKTLAIEVKDLTKVYPGNIRAVNGVTFTVAEGEIFGMLGPNGAGKSTIITMLTTLSSITSGTALVAGEDVAAHPERVRRAIGYVSQDLAVDDNLTGWENLFLQAKFYGLTNEQIGQRLKEVLTMVNLMDRANDLVETYSGGMRKRLDIAEGLIHRPRILFLDEPTLGLDIQTRQEIWKYILFLREEVEMTIFLTTHYMEEADRLCDRIAIIDRGVIKAIDTPDRLKAEIGGDVITMTLNGSGHDITRALELIKGLSEVRQIKSHAEEYIVIAENGELTVPKIFEVIRDTGMKITKITVKRPTLDDVYLHFTGRGLRDELEGSKEEGFRQRMVMRRVRRR